MEPYYDHAGITIYHGDCREILPELEPVDGLLTDPPYGIGFREYGAHDDSASGYAEILKRIWLAEESVSTGGWCVVFQSETTVKNWASWFPRDFRIYAIPKKFGQIGREMVMRQTDFALYWRCGVKPWTREDWEFVRGWQPPTARNWFVSSDASRTRERPNHPCPRPLDAMRQLVATFVPPLETVLDPFMGSGTTLRAAKDLGRRAIGIEIEERYCEIAAKRLAQEVLPFA